MPSFKLNLARMENCPPVKDLAGAMESFGLPEGEEFGVLNCTAGEAAVYATLVRRTHQTIQRLDAERKDVISDSVEKVAVYSVGVFPKRRMLELYEGPAAGVEHVAAFLAGPLGQPTTVRAVDLDIPSAVEKLRTSLDRFDLKGLRISEYAHSSYVAGPYAPKFLDSEHGMEFLSKHADLVTAVTVRFQGPGGRATVHLTPQACFRYSLTNEDDKATVQAVLRKLV